jgi:hypothetical protein
VLIITKTGNHHILLCSFQTERQKTSMWTG